MILSGREIISRACTPQQSVWYASRQAGLSRPWEARPLYRYNKYPCGTACPHHFLLIDTDGVDCFEKTAPATFPGELLGAHIPLSRFQQILFFPSIRFGSRDGRPCRWYSRLCLITPRICLRSARTPETSSGQIDFFFSVFYFFRHIFSFLCKVWGLAKTREKAPSKRIAILNVFIVYLIIFVYCFLSFSGSRTTSFRIREKCDVFKYEEIGYDYTVLDFPQRE